jgi:protein subunit release factor A
MQGNTQQSSQRSNRTTNFLQHLCTDGTRIDRTIHYLATIMSNIRGLFDGKKDDDSDDDSKGNNNRFVGGISAQGGGR